MAELTTDVAEPYVRGLEQDFENAGDWGVQPTLMLICTPAGQDPNSLGLLGLVPVFRDEWIRTGQLTADALEGIDPAMLCSLVPPPTTLVAVAVAYEAKVLDTRSFGKDARLLYCGLADGTLVGAGRVRGDEANVTVYAPDHPHDTTPAAVRRLAIAVLGSGQRE
ncbi:hypothetical protein [Nonomuraea sp. NPDC049141]|uniref:hypothetical protein n=1 Tax=Nonomuraea sp. NPDC049141 TaxID=3155500 RepID=UPI003405F952